jgi:O-methyltransferase
LPKNNFLARSDQKLAYNYRKECMSTNSFFRQMIRNVGFDIVRYRQEMPLPPDFDAEYAATISRVRAFTMTSPERLFALCQAVRYVVDNKIPGDIVECGVWKGGSMMAVAKTLKSLNEDSRHLYLFDTFEGMTAPSEHDVDFMGVDASKQLVSSTKQEMAAKDSIWCYAPLEEVKSAVYSVGYDLNKIHFIKGKVEDTIPNESPATIALLRLDTDWYESTHHELINLFPRISSGGVIIIDDYGHWQGARKAVDEYIKDNKIQILLNRIDSTGRIGIVVKY